MPPLSVNRNSTEVEKSSGDELSSLLSNLKIEPTNETRTSRKSNDHVDKAENPEKSSGSEGNIHTGVARDDDDVTAALEKLSSLSLSGKEKAKKTEGKERTSFKLRDYQKSLVQNIKVETEVNGVKSVLVYLPTGGGKTVIASHLIRKRLKREQRCMFVVNRSTLIDQTAKALEKCGIAAEEYGFIKSGYKMNNRTRKRMIQISSIQTFSRRTKSDKVVIMPKTSDKENKPSKVNGEKACRVRTPLGEMKESPKNESVYGDFDLIILDEAHGAVAAQYIDLLNLYPDACIVGLTATPFRLDPNDDLGKVFQKGISGPSVRELIERRILVRPIVYAPSTASFSTLTNAAATSENAIASAVMQWKKYCMVEGPEGLQGLRTIVFCSTIAQSKKVVSKFLENGIFAEHIDGKTSKRKRTEVLHRLQKNITTVIASVGVLSEGFDEPLVGALICLRPTESKGLYIQQIGRGLRCLPAKHLLEDETMEKKFCIILDEVGNTHKHGPVDGPKSFGWESSAKSSPSEQSNAIKEKSNRKYKLRPYALRLCKKEKCYVLIHPNMRRCVLCQNKLESKKEQSLTK